MEYTDPIKDEPAAELLKPELEEPKAKMNVWLKSLSSLVLYLVIGYLFFNKNWTLVLILTGVVIFHELGHFFAMKIFKYQELGIFFIPLMGAYVSGSFGEALSFLLIIVVLIVAPAGIFGRVKSQKF